MKVDENTLEKRYKKLGTAELIHLKNKGGLTEDAYSILSKELDTRKIDEETLANVNELSQIGEALDYEQIKYRKLQM